MALRDQPYLPLYIQDYMTDEKLNECSAEANGVYIRVMFLMHKSEKYGKILLNQKHKQTDNQISNFASMFAKHFPYSFDEILRGLTELNNEKVIFFDGDYICQKRMIRDGQLSEIRSIAGKKGGKKVYEIGEDFAIAKSQANTENENEYYNSSNKGGVGEKEEIEDGIPLEPQTPSQESHPIQIREQLFIAECNSFYDPNKKTNEPGYYPESMIKDFIRYWTEPNRSKTKMRFENERTWDTARRLVTWKNNETKFTGNGNSSKTGNTAISRQSAGSNGTRKTTI